MKKLFDLKNLPYYAALFQALQFAHAGSVYFGPFGWVIGGVGGGIVNFIIAGSASRINDVAKSRKVMSYVFGLVLLTLSPLAIAPAVYITSSAIEWPWMRWMVAVVWSLLPDLSIALAGAVVGKSLISHSDGTAKGATVSEPTAKRTAKGAKKNAKEMRECDVDGCKIEYTWPQGKGAHYKKHHPDLVVPKGIALKDVMASVNDKQKAEN